jgi:erythromycin esterase-like protein
MPSATTVRTAASALLLGLAAACGGGGAAPTPPGEAPAPAAALPPAPAPAPGAAAQAIRAAARPIAGTDADYPDLMAAARDAHRILLGESTHGTHEYYRERARLSERLVREHGIVAIAIEGDWSPTYRVNLYVRGLGTDRTAAEALSGYERFPEWMWPNTDFRDFVERLRAWNMARPAQSRVGVYGMDVYDMFEAADAVIAWLREVDPAAAREAERHYRCLRPYGRDTARYGAATLGGRASCADEAQAASALVRRVPRPADPVAAERHFAARRAAASVVNAEAYFRTAYGGSLAWNVRDRAMAENVEEIAAHLTAQGGRPAKVVMWSHNTHSGDARATFAANRGELNLGQLMRQRHGDDAFLVGLFSHSGRVFAAPGWDERGRVYDMRPALPGSWSALFREAGLPAFSLLMRGNPALRSALAQSRLERAIGVVYSPETERQSHYFEAELPQQFDAAIFFETTTPVTPLRR